MKKTILSLLAFCCTLLSSADPINKQAALYTAQSYLTAKGKILSSNPSTRRGAKDFSQEGEEYFYIFNAGNDGGYVIVSGDDRTEPILGYVEQGTFDPDNIPENMRSWLQLYADQIKYIIDNDIAPSSPLLKKRDKVRGTKHSVPEILTSRWNQGLPYNLTCPKYYEGDGTQYYPASGCVATAMAQVVNFYKFPEKTKAVIPAHSNTYTLDNGTVKTVSMGAIPKGTVIDWENMRDTYSWEEGHIANAQDTAVANLMLYCGQAVKMGYGASSGAVTALARDVFVNMFGFDDSAVWHDRSSHFIDDWFDLLYSEIEQGYPILFNGFSSGGGHAFVLDGFDGDNLFHVNWGWGGGSNGWFLVGILNPGDTSGIGASSSSDGYSMGQGALIGLRLPDNVNAEPTSALTINDVAINGTSIFGNWINWTGAAGNFNTGIVKLDDDGTLSLVGAQQTIRNMGVNSYQGKTFQIKGRLPEGTYKLSPASKLATGKVWRTKYNMHTEYIEAVVDANGTPTMRFVTPTESISIDTIVFPGTRIVGTEQEVKVTFRNNGDEYYKEVHFFASKTNDKVYTENRSPVAVRKGETVDVSYFFTPGETGTYNLWFCTGSDGSGQVGQGTMEVIEESQATKANLSVTSFTVSNTSSSTAYGNCLVGKVVVKNNGKTAFNGQIRFQILEYWDGDEYGWFTQNQTATVSIAAGRTATVDFNFEELNNIGCNYYLSVCYVGQDGCLSGADTWEHGWKMAAGYVTWTKTGVISGKAYASATTVVSNACGFYANCNNFTRLTPNSNENTIYAFGSSMTVPSTLDDYNAVSGNHANHINLVNNKAFYVPVNFEADEATFTYTFPETETGSGWHTFTMPFKPTSITVDDNPVSLDDDMSHFWIYEFAATGDDGEIIFAPATELRGATPYIIAADATMAGRSVVFHATDALFYKTGSDKMIVSSQDYKFYGTTLGPSVKGCYVLNTEGTAFEYTTTSKTLAAQGAYFATTLPEEQRLPSIVLPEVPKKASLSLNEHKATLIPGEELQLEVSTTSSSLLWTSTDENVATVSDQGLVTAKALGTTDIIVSDPDDPTLADTCTVTVIKEHLGHRYYQLAIDATSGDGQIQLSEFDLLDMNGEEIKPLTTYYYTGEYFGEEYQTHLFDDNIETKYCGPFTNGNTLYIYIDAGERVALSGYRMTTGNDTETYPGRNPVTWSLLGSNTQSQQPDDDVWTLLDRRENDNTLQAVNLTPYDFFFTYPPSYDYEINDETTSLYIAAEGSGKKVTFTHEFSGEWEALYLPFAINYDDIKADFDLAEIDEVVQYDDNNDGTADITVLSIMDFTEQATMPNTPYLIRAKNAGEHTLLFDDITVYPTTETSLDRSSTSIKYEFTGSYNTLDATTLAERYIVKDGELVKGAVSLAPCRWYMTATAREGKLNLPSEICIMPVDEVIGITTLKETEEGSAIYNLSGQRLNKMLKGINIVNGKKAIKATR